MCAESIKTIARELIEAGRRRSTPIAIIRWGTYDHQEIYSGTLNDLAHANDETGNSIRIEPPAIAVVGDVVSLQDKLHWFGDLSARRSLGFLSSDEPLPLLES
jgi:siroheme synthase